MFTQCSARPIKFPLNDLQRWSAAGAGSGTLSPAAAAGARTGRTISASAAASVASIEESCTAKGVRRPARRPRSTAARAHSPARPSFSRHRRAEPRGRDAAARSASPSIARISGFRKMIGADEAPRPGLPGRPSTRMAPSRPTISGLPGRMAIFQKSSAMPRRCQRRLHEVVVADRGAADRRRACRRPAARSTKAAIASRLSGAMPRSIALAAALAHEAPRGRRRSRRRSGPGPVVVAGRHELVAGGEDRDARPAADGQGGVAHRRGERDGARVEQRGPPAAARRRRGSRARRGG